MRLLEENACCLHLAKKRDQQPKGQTVEIGIPEQEEKFKLSNNFEMVLLAIRMSPFTLQKLCLFGKAKELNLLIKINDKGCHSEL